MGEKLSTDGDGGDFYIQSREDQLRLFLCTADPARLFNIGSPVYYAGRIIKVSHSGGDHGVDGFRVAALDVGRRGLGVSSEDRGRLGGAA
jgi:hypothetical protein